MTADYCTPIPYRGNLGLWTFPDELLPEGVHPETLAIGSADLFAIDLAPDRLSPRCAMPLTIIRPSGKSVAITLRAAIETSLEITLLKSGGLIPHVLGGLLSSRSP